VEESVFARALNYNWPPGSWAHWSVSQFVRFCMVEQKVAEARRPQVGPATAPPMSPTGRDMADDDDED
jgi:hypothetical protein